MLTVKQIEALRSGNCPERVPDGNGLYLRVVKSGNKTFQTRTKVNGKLKWITLGSYPEMTLKEARVKSALAKASVSETPSPANDLIDAFKPDQKVANPEEAPKFRQIADKWFEMKKAGLSNGKHIHQNWRTLETYVLPYLGDVPITENRRKDIIAIFNPIWRAKNETATRTLNRVKEVFELACALEIVEHNPAVFSTKAAFGRVKRIVKHHKALDWERVPEFHSWIQSLDSSFKCNTPAQRA